MSPFRSFAVMRRLLALCPVGALDPDSLRRRVPLVTALVDLVGRQPARLADDLADDARRVPAAREVVVEAPRRLGRGAPLEQGPAPSGSLPRARELVRLCEGAADG